MKLLKKIRNYFVYNLTQKPECYVHIDKPKSLQDERQIQYNKWCKRYGVYNGSYLPDNHKILTKKGWVDATSRKNKSGSNEIYYRKSTGQTIRHEAKTSKKDEHYHWFSEKGYPARNLAKATKSKFLLIDMVKNVIEIVNHLI